MLEEFARAFLPTAAATSAKEGVDGRHQARRRAEEAASPGPYREETAQCLIPEA
jgi:hypothetical protein